jgi:hypothetical protein
VVWSHSLQDTEEGWEILKQRKPPVRKIGGIILK